MIPARMPLRLHLTLVLGFAFLSGVPAVSDSAESHVVERKLRSEKIMNNKIGTDPARKMLVYLPAGYNERSSQRYLVIYFLPQGLHKAETVKTAS